MCQAGGPRCSSHALKSVKRNQTEISTLQEKDAPQSKIREKQKELTRNILVYYSTPKGQEKLQEKRDQAEGEEQEKLDSMIVKAQKLRKKQVKEGEEYRRNILIDSPYQDEVPRDVLKEQRKLVEGLQRRKEATTNPYSKNALEANIERKEHQPQWNEDRETFAQSIYGTHSEVIDTFNHQGQDIDVVWEEHSTLPQDDDLQINGGYQVSRIGYYDAQTGAEIGYVKTVETNPESLKKAFGDDEYSIYRMMNERERLHYGGYDRVEKEVGGRTFKKQAYDFSIEKAKTETEKTEALKDVWAASYKHLDKLPESTKDSGLYTAYNITPEHAPSDVNTLKSEITRARREFEEMRAHHINNGTHPHIDFSKLNEEYKGKGLSTSMYIYLARKLGERGKTLSSSGIQSDEAQNLWSSIVKKKDLPLKVSTTKFVKGDFLNYSNRHSLDFTKKK